MELEVTIQQVNSFKVTIGGKEYNDFKKVSEWNGMLEFKGPSGKIIVHKKNDMAITFASIFGDVDQTEASLFDVAKISPSLIPCEDK